MRRSLHAGMLVPWIGAVLWAGTPTSAAEQEALRPARTIELPNVEGRIDHLAVDLKGKRLFVAALGNNTIEVIDLAAGRRVRSVAGIRKPQGLAFVPDGARLAAAGGDDGVCRIYDTEAFKPLSEVKGLDDADNVRYDAAAKRLYVGFGEGAPGALAVIDPQTGKKAAADIPLAAHPESFRLEEKGHRIFVNIPQDKAAREKGANGAAAGAAHVEVVDRQAGKVVAKWPVPNAADNYPMWLDEPQHRLFVACRRPAVLLVYDTESGKVVATVACAGDADDLFHDAANKRVYVIGGEGVISVIDQRDPDHYQPAGSVKTAPGARTGLFVPETGMLYVAVPHRGAQKAEVRIFETPKGV